MKSEFFVIISIMLFGWGCAEKRDKVSEGIYIERHENGSIYVMGTYNGGKRDGVWSVFDESSKLQSQGYYENDTVRVKLKSLIEFTIFEKQDLGYKILFPQNFNDLKQTEERENVLLLKTFNDSTFEGVCIMNIISLQSNDSLSTLIHKNMDEIKKIPDVTVVLEEKNAICYKININGNYTVVMSKILLNEENSRSYTLTCTFPAKASQRLYPMFRTVLNSFELVNKLT